MKFYFSTIQQLLMEESYLTTYLHPPDYEVRRSEFSYNSAGEDGSVLYIGRAKSRALTMRHLTEGVHKDKPNTTAQPLPDISRARAKIWSNYTTRSA